MRACADEFLATATEGAFRTTPLTTNYTICSVNDTPIFGRYLMSLETVLPPSKTSNRGTYCLLCEWDIGYSTIVCRNRDLFQ